MGNLEGVFESLHAAGVLPASFWAWINIPDLAAAGINTLILVIDYGFQFKSHPELRQGSAPITPEGARRLINSRIGSEISNSSYSPFRPR